MNSDIKYYKLDNTSEIVDTKLPLKKNDNIKKFNSFNISVDELSAYKLNTKNNSFRKEFKKIKSFSARDSKKHNMFRRSSFSEINNSTNNTNSTEIFSSKQHFDKTLTSDYIVSSNISLSDNNEKECDMEESTVSTENNSEVNAELDYLNLKFTSEKTKTVTCLIQSNNVDEQKSSNKENKVSLDISEEYKHCEGLFERINSHITTSDEEETLNSQSNIFELNNIQKNVLPDLSSEKTPKHNFVMKSNNITPMANYDTMNTPKIIKELDKFGLKILKRKRGVQILKHIYESTHPIIQSSEEENDVQSEVKILTKRKKIKEVIVNNYETVRNST